MSVKQTLQHKKYLHNMNMHNMYALYFKDTF